MYVGVGCVGVLGVCTHPTPAFITCIMKTSFSFAIILQAWWNSLLFTIV